LENQKNLEALTKSAGLIDLGGAANLWCCKGVVMASLGPDSPGPLQPDHNRELSLRERIVQAEEISRAALEKLIDLDSMPELKAELSLNGEVSWAKHEPLSISLMEARTIAARLFKSSMAKSGDRMVVEVTPDTIGVVEQVLELCDKNNVEVEFDFRNFAREAIMAKHLSDDAAEGQPSALKMLAQYRLNLYQGVDKALRVITNPDSSIEAFSDRAKSNALERHMAPRQAAFRDGSLHYIVTIIPTASDARLDGIEHSEYLRLFLEACDQPWEEIHEAQNKLKEKFDRANRVRITNSDGTDITFEITGQTFANSVVMKNLPGSEIFSSALREGASGTIVAKGRFQYGASGTIEDIKLVFEKGRIVDFDARIGKTALAEILAMDDAQGEGSRHLGELAFGTNPHLRQHMINRLLVEKICGSFHVAIGSCYNYDVYCGEPVQLKNGNKSVAGVHWDVTTMLRGKAGHVELVYDTPQGEDKECVQLNGEWLVPGCDVLNLGWGALPPARAPAWWGQRYPAGYSQN